MRACGSRRLWAANGPVLAETYQQLRVVGIHGDRPRVVAVAAVVGRLPGLARVVAPCRAAAAGLVRPARRRADARRASGRPAARRAGDPASSRRRPSSASGRRARSRPGAGRLRAGSARSSARATSTAAAESSRSVARAARGARRARARSRRGRRSGTAGSARCPRRPRRPRRSRRARRRALRQRAVDPAPAAVVRAPHAAVPQVRRRRCRGLRGSTARHCAPLPSKDSSTFQRRRSPRAARSRPRCRVQARHVNSLGRALCVSATDQSYVVELA